MQNQTKRRYIKSRMRSGARAGTLRRKNKNNNYFHPALFQKQGAYGMSTFSSKLIPTDTLIIREKIHNISTLTKLSPEYPFAVISHLLKTKLKEFMNMVPHALDETTIIDYEPVRENHLKYMPQLSVDEFKLCYMKYKRNAFSFNLNPGILFYATKLNHSCNPHVSYRPAEDGIMMEFRTIRPIDAGSEVFDSYIGTSSPYEERQTTLMKRYGFKCACEKCVQKN